jgi:hypothetical protein
MNHLRPLIPYDIINPMQMVSFLWEGDVTSHILITLDRLAGVSNSLRLMNPTLCPSADWHGHRRRAAIERPLLSPYDIINPMQIVSFLWGGDVICIDLRLLSPYDIINPMQMV